MQARSGETGSHFRLGKAKITESVLWVIGSVDLVLFDARSMTFTGPALERVPLFLVNGLGRKASLFEAQLVAQAELFRLFADDLGNALIESSQGPIATAPDPERLASLLCEWPSTIGTEARNEVIEHLLGLQEAASRAASIQDFVAASFVRQHGDVTFEDLSGQGRFPDKLPEPGVTYCRVLQDYDPEPLFRPQRERDKSGIMRTDYPLW